MVEHQANYSLDDEEEEELSQPTLLLATDYVSLQQQLLSPGLYSAVFSTPRISLPTTRVSESNEDNYFLKERLLGDVLIGSVVTAIVSPALTVIDKAMVQKSAGNASLMGSALTSMSSMLRNPVAYLKSPTFLYMWLTYAATYSAANSIKTLTEYQHCNAKTSQLQTRPPNSTNTASKANSSTDKRATSERAIFFGTTFANTSACLVKDRAYAQLFGNAAATRVPKISYAAWVLRDFTVIGSSFVLPEYVAPLVQDSFSLSETSARQFSQVLTPMAAQVVASPLHFLGLDCFNRDLSHLSIRSRVLSRSHFLASTFRQAAMARMIRILPGYGVAGVWNTQLRNQWREYIVQRNVATQLAPIASRQPALI